MNEKQSEAENRADRGRRKAATPQPGESAASSGEQTEDLAARLDQVDVLVAKGIDLAELGLTLGVKLASKLSNALQLQTGELFDRSMGNNAEIRAMPADGPGGRAAPAYPPQPERPAAPEPPPAFNYIMNRAPLFPGNPVRLSFTINNDSPSSPREVRLVPDGFVGVTHGLRLDGNAFAVEPATRVVAPLDFDKFTLVGIIPPDAVADAYDGWVVVSAEEGLRIPVRLIVAAVA